MNGDDKPWWQSARVWIASAALLLVILEASIPGFEIDVERLKTIALVLSSLIVGDSLRSVRKKPPVPTAMTLEQLKKLVREE